MKYTAPEGCPGVTLMDKFYPAENGVVDVPDIPHDLEANGFTAYVEQPAPAKATQAKDK
jgi:hypothetical protein